jgi:hypothetical protein
MTTDSLRELLRAMPFVPFRVRLSNGDVHEVVHRDFAMVTKSNLVVSFPGSDRLAICSILHIASVETGQATAS